jgi:hypothetical protein
MQSIYLVQIPVDLKVCNCQILSVEAGTDPMLNILKQVQEAGDPTF